MKKLLFTLVAAAACGAVTADNVPATATFENYGDKQFSVLLKDDGTELVNDGGYWTSLITEDSSSEFTLTAYGSGKYLQINTGNLPLWRTFSSVGKTTAVTGNPPDGIDADGVVVSSDVKLTACTEFPKLTDFPNEKLALFLFAPEEGDDTPEGLYAIGGEMTGEGLKAKAYKLNIDVKGLNVTNAQGWANVSIKTYGDIYNSGSSTTYPAFVIGINDKVVGVDEDYYITGFEDDANLIPAATARITGKTLIPAALTGDGTIAGLGFQGEGGIDNVNLFADDFATDAVAFTVAGDGAAKATFDNSLKPDLNGVITVPASVTSVSFTLNLAANEKATVTYKSGETDVGNLTNIGDTYTFAPVANATLTITVETLLFQANGKGYATFAEALAAALAEGGDGEVKLLGDGTVDLGATVLTIESGTVTIDLNGQTLTCSDEYVICNVAGTVTIKDSATGGKVASGTVGSVMNAGALTILAGDYVGAITSTGTLTINGGRFKVTEGIAVPTDKEWSAADTDGYYTLENKAGNTPTVGEGEGSVEVDTTTGDAEITPAAGKTEITVTIPTGFTGNIIVPSTVTTVKGDVPAEKLGLKIGVHTVIGAFKINETTYAIELNKDAEVKVGTEDIKVEPELATVDADGETAVEPFVAGDKPAATVKTIPGLKYSLIWDADVGGSFGNVAVEPTQATSSRMKLEDENTNGATKRFYKVKVTK